MVGFDQTYLLGPNRGYEMTPLFQILNKRLPERLAILLMVAIYAGVIFGLALTVGYEYRTPVLYLDAR